MTEVGPGRPVDLRSDTITQPSRQMRHAMAAAEVGDDVFGDDPTVLELERRTAELLGHQAGLFVVSGSMGNLLGVRCLAEPGTEVLCDVDAHIAKFELGAHSAVHGLSVRTFGNDHGRLVPDLVQPLLAPDAGPYLVSTRAVAVENTHGTSGGTLQPFSALVEVSGTCRAAGIGLHLDGARLWNAHVATGTALVDFGRLFDTVTVCLSKGLGAPIGSVLVSSAENVARARVWRKRLGGGWRQAGILAAAGMYAIDHNLARLEDDHEAARAFAAELPDQPVPETNMIMVMTSGPAADVVSAAAGHGVRLSAVGPTTVRAVTSLAVTVDQCALAGRIVADLV